MIIYVDIPIYIYMYIICIYIYIYHFFPCFDGFSNQCLVLLRIVYDYSAQIDLDGSTTSMPHPCLGSLSKIARQVKIDPCWMGP